MSDDKKIIIDEDWKAQVAAEREAAELSHAEPATAPPTAAGEPPAGDRADYPPASFEMLVSIFAAEAMTGLGQLPNPMTQKREVELGQARYAIDMLEMLAEKTKGNLDAGEEAGLGQLLHQLRMAFLAEGREKI